MAQTLTTRPTQQSSVSAAVVSAVAALTDTEPTSMEPLYGTIDADALDTLFEPTVGEEKRGPERITFTYQGCDVVVSGDGTVKASRSQRETKRRWT